MRAPYRLTRTWMLCLAALSCAPEADSNTSTQAGPSATLAQALTPATDALYDTPLAAPACMSPGAACDSRSTLTGRGTVGPESNAPNTLGGSCADGEDGTFHAEGSVDALRISTVDGVSHLAQGRTVKVEADVWGAPSGGSALMFFQAADARSPQWVHLATLPTTGGAQTLSTTFTLPAGSMQAVRAALLLQRHRPRGHRHRAALRARLGQQFHLWGPPVRLVPDAGHGRGGQQRGGVRLAVGQQ